MNTKIGMKNIRIYGSESAYIDDETFDTWFDAGICIRAAAFYAPKGGAYDKTKFVVTFEDGTEYGGRLDIQHYTMPYPGNDNDLAQHILSFVRFHTGDHCPSHMTEEDYQNYLNALGPETTQSYQEFLDTFEIPESDGVVPTSKWVNCKSCQRTFTPSKGEDLCGRCAQEKETEDRQQAEIEAARAAKEADPLYPILKAGRTEVTKKMRQLLRKRSGKTWSVKGGRGTGWGWLTIVAPPSRMDNWKMTPEDQEELGLLLGENVHCQGASVSGDSWWYYLKACRGDFSEYEVVQT